MPDFEFDGKDDGVASRGTARSRRYLPTLSDLVDRLTIVQQKAIFIPDKKDAYLAEMTDIMHDIDLMLNDHAGKGRLIGAREIRAICVIQLTNRWIWENEAIIRHEDGSKLSDEKKMEFYRRLVATHSINGVRNSAKNELAVFDGGRKDHKIDCFAAELVEEFGNWDVFGGNDH